MIFAGEMGVVKQLAAEIGTNEIVRPMVLVDRPICGMMSP
jgi:hypothetical protein